MSVLVIIVAIVALWVWWKMSHYKDSAWEDLMTESVNNGLSPADVEEFHAMTVTPVDISLD